MNRIFAIRARIAGKKSSPARVPAILLFALATAILLAGDAAWAVATKVETLETAITNNNSFGFDDKNSGTPVTAVEITSPDFVLGGKVKEGKNFGTDISALSVILTQINDKMTDSDLLKLVADVTASASGLITSLNTDGMSQITSGANRKWRNHTSAAAYSGGIGDFIPLRASTRKKYCSLGTQPTDLACEICILTE